MPSHASTPHPPTPTWSRGVQRHCITLTQPWLPPHLHFHRAKDNVWQLNLFTRLIHGARDEILFRDQRQWHRFPDKNMQLCKLFLKALEHRQAPGSQHKHLLAGQSERSETVLFQLIRRHLSFCGACACQTGSPGNLLIHSQTSLLKQEMMPGKKKEAILFWKSEGLFKWRAWKEWSPALFLRFCFAFVKEKNKASSKQAS